MPCFKIDVSNIKLTPVTLKIRSRSKFSYGLKVLDISYILVQAIMCVAVITLELEPFEVYIGYNGKSEL